MTHTSNMAFNHYAKLKRILAEHGEWYIRRINEPTSTTNFKGETVHYDHYYRLFDITDQPIKYGKFQKLDKFAQTIGIPAEDLPVVE